jgi:hypothetical protein
LTPPLSAYFSGKGEKNIKDPHMNSGLWSTLAMALGFTGEQRITEYAFLRALTPLYLSLV